MHVSRLGLVVCCLAMIACNKTPAPPVMDVPGTAETISGTERIGWDQPAADAIELAAIGYAIYVDGSRAELAGAACATVATAAGFSCSVRLPSLLPGSHTLQLAAFVNDGGLLESARSASLRVTVTPAVTARDAGTTANAGGAKWASGMTAVTASGVRMRAELIADGLDQPTDLAFTPDGRLLVAERLGRIRIVRHGQLLPDPALSMTDTLGPGGTLLALAVDPQFDRSRHVFAIVTAAERSGVPAFSIMRFREVSDTLGDRAVILDGVSASSDPRASLRFGADAKLYAAFDDGGNAGRAGDLASWNGKILRLNIDGTTPGDQPGATPLYSASYGSPRGFDWDPRSGTLWVADGARTGPWRLRAVGGGAYALPPSTVPSSAAFYRGELFPAFAGSLLVASDEGRHLLRVQFDSQTVTQPVSIERLLQDRVGGLRAVAVGPDGAIYFATANAIGRLVPDVE